MLRGWKIGLGLATGNASLLYLCDMAQITGRTAEIWRVTRIPLLRNPVNVELLSERMTALFNLSGQHTLSSLGLYQVYFEDSPDDEYLFRAHFSRLDFLHNLPAIPRHVTSRLPLESLQTFSQPM